MSISRQSGHPTKAMKGRWGLYIIGSRTWREKQSVVSRKLHFGLPFQAQTRTVPGRPRVEGVGEPFRSAKGRIQGPSDFCWWVREARSGRFPRASRIRVHKEAVGLRLA